MIVCSRVCCLLLFILVPAVCCPILRVACFWFGPRVTDWDLSLLTTPVPGLEIDRTLTSEAPLLVDLRRPVIEVKCTMILIPSTTLLSYNTVELSVLCLVVSYDTNMCIAYESYYTSMTAITCEKQTSSSLSCTTFLGVVLFSTAVLLSPHESFKPRDRQTTDCYLLLLMVSNRMRFSLSCPVVIVSPNARWSFLLASVIDPAIPISNISNISSLKSMPCQQYKLPATARLIAHIQAGASAEGFKQAGYIPYPTTVERG